MAHIKLKVLNAAGHTLAVCNGGENVFLHYTGEYREGDRICLEADEAGLACEIRLDDSMAPAFVYLADKTYDFTIPFGQMKLAYSPKSFYGSRHLISAGIAGKEFYARRNLAFNPFDQNGKEGMYPHASANIETRGEAVFAARNTIDGIFANNSHGEYPFQSWGINQRPDAELKIDFGIPVNVNEVRLTLRADFPHDNYWVKGTLLFSDGTEETVSLKKSALPQTFIFDEKVIEWVVLKDLIPSGEASPFPALTQIEVFGNVARGNGEK